MQRVFTSSFIVFASLAGGCVADTGDESFVLQDMLAPPQDDCVFTANIAGPFLSRGFTGFNFSEFDVAAQYQSRVVAGEGKESLRTIFIQGANIELRISPMVRIENNVTTFDNSTEGTEQFQLLFSSSLPPNGGLSIGIFPLIPPDIMAKLRTSAGDAAIDPNISLSVEVDATITSFGDFYGDRLDSSPFSYAVNVTNQTVISLGTCPLPMTTVVPDPVTGCQFFGQNVDPCCKDASAGLVCPPTFAP